MERDSAFIQAGCLSDDGMEKRMLTFKEPADQCVYNQFETARNIHDSTDKSNCSDSRFDHIWTARQPFSNCSDDTLFFVISSSSLNRIPKYLFRQFRSIQFFFMNSQNISELTSEDLANADDLKGLYLPGNRLKYFNWSVLDNIRELSYLNLEHNQIAFFSSNTKIGHTFDTLQEINLNNNHLTKVPSELKDHIESLYILKLSHNKIIAVDMEDIMKMSPKELYLNNNNISVISNVHLLADSQLRTIDISNNPLADAILSNALNVNNFQNNSNCLHDFL